MFDNVPKSISSMKLNLSCFQKRRLKSQLR
jgi:hypothetical protein